MISLLFIPNRAKARLRVNSEDGFPHSEICGSKVAHTSPQLIAACHVLHRLCMPRHPPIALTSRLRIHTINDNSGTRIVDVPSAFPGPCIPRTPLVAAVSKDGHSQLDNLVVIGRISRRISMPPRHRFLEPIHNVKEGPNAPPSAAKAAKIRSSYLEICKQP